MAKTYDDLKLFWIDGFKPTNTDYNDLLDTTKDVPTQGASSTTNLSTVLVNGNTTDKELTLNSVKIGNGEIISKIGTIEEIGITNDNSITFKKQNGLTTKLKTSTLTKDSVLTLPKDTVEELVIKEDIESPFIDISYDVTTSSNHQFQEDNVITTPSTFPNDDYRYLVNTLYIKVEIIEPYLTTPNTFMFFKVGGTEYGNQTFDFGTVGTYYMIIGNNSSNFNNILLNSSENETLEMTFDDANIPQNGKSRIQIKGTLTKIKIPKTF